jgi:hypothetical protein
MPLHVHGGISIDVDFLIHRYFLWLKRAEFSPGSATPELLRIGKVLAETPAQLSEARGRAHAADSHAGSGYGCADLANFDNRSTGEVEWRPAHHNHVLRARLCTPPTHQPRRAGSRLFAGSDSGAARVAGTIRRAPCSSARTAPAVRTSSTHRHARRRAAT